MTVTVVDLLTGSEPQHNRANTKAKGRGCDQWHPCEIEIKVGMDTAGNRTLCAATVGV